MTTTSTNSYENYSKIRDEVGFTDYSVSKSTGIAQSTFSDWKSGRSKPKVEKLILIAQTLGTTVEKIVTG